MRTQERRIPLFTIIYGLPILAILASFALTIVRRESWQAIENRLWIHLYALMGVLITILILEFWFFDIMADKLWFEELKQGERFWLTLQYRAMIFMVVAGSMFAFVGGNLILVTRPIEKLPQAAVWWIASLIIVVAAYLATNLWVPVVAYLGASQTGVTDPILGFDVSYYLFSLSLYSHVLAIAQGIVFVVFVAVAAAATAYPSYGNPFYSDEQHEIFRSMVHASHGRSQEESADACLHDWHVWAVQVCFLAALWCILHGLAVLLDRYELVVKGSSSVVSGAAYADVNGWMTSNLWIAYAWFAMAIVILLGMISQVRRVYFTPLRPKGFFSDIPRVSVSLVVLALVYLAGNAVPIVVQQFGVGPNENTWEEPYLRHDIAHTRAAFGLTGERVVEKEFFVSPKQFTEADLVKYQPVIQDARVWDWKALHALLQQYQGLRNYYHLGDVDIDRYIVDGRSRQVMVSPREIDITLLPSEAQKWVNQRLKYTHGYGMVGVPVNEHDGDGKPIMWSSDIPVKAKSDMAVKHNQIYFGEYTKEPVYVLTTEKEFDHPEGSANAETVYEGTGGIELSNWLRKLTFANRIEGFKLYTSGYFTDQSRVLWRRDISTRVKKLAPFLLYDHDPYIVAGGDRFYWIQDAYTASKWYPYSKAYDGALTDYKGYNYIRNSVKAVIDAYDGSVTFYVFDANDPIVNAYRRMFPGLFKDAREMPEQLRRHVRYPEDLFTIQTEMYAKYHMTNPQTFYNQEDLWEVPKELYYGKYVPMDPYYVTSQLPDSSLPEFMLMRPMTVAKKNLMAGWLAGLCDGDNYGKLIAYRFQKGVSVEGPAQVESNISSKDEMARQLTMWDQRGSKVIRGNLLILPIGESLIAVEPVYIEDENQEQRIPQLTRVIFGQLMPGRQNIVWANTLADAQNVLVGALERTLAQPSGATTAQAVTGETIDTVRKIFGEMRSAFSSGDFNLAGQKLEQLKRILQPE